MTSAAKGTCEHCRLSLGAWPHDREVDGEDHRFCCYGCFIGWQVARGGGEEATAAGLLIRLGIGAFLAMNIMLFSLAIYSGGIDASDPWIRQVFHYVLWLFATPVMVILGGPFMAEATADLIRGRLGASTLIALGATAAYVYSAVVTLGGGERVYFDTATMVLGLFTLGRFLEANGRARAARNLAPMLRPHSLEVSVVTGDREIPTRLSDVRAGDLVRILPGDRIAVDGVVAEGTSSIDESWLTGEGRPMGKAIGDDVLAGTINLDGMLCVRATVDGLKTRWAGICGALHDALTRPNTIQTVTDRVAAWFVPGVLMTALGTVWYWASVGPFDDALMHGLAVLVVACPCALGLAAPLVTALALERLAKNGCLVRSGDVVYRLAGVRHLAVDKTGTLTLGAVRVAEVVADGVAPDEILRRAGSLETGSRHPLARGIVTAMDAQGLTPLPITSVRAVPGSGVKGVLNGGSVAVGAARWFREKGWLVPPVHSECLDREEQAGRSGVHVGWGGTVYGTILFDDEIHPETISAVARLRGMGLHVAVLSGDAPDPVGRVAQACGINHWQAGLLPEDKAKAVALLQRNSGRTAMIGDGINDGPALQTAEIGIAVGDGVDLARETADVVLPGSGLSRLPGIIALARRAKRLVMANFAWALAYNILAVGLAAMGLLQPVIAAALMAGSSFLVIANSLRLDQGKSADDHEIIETPLARKSVGASVETVI